MLICLQVSHEKFENRSHNGKVFSHRSDKHIGCCPQNRSRCESESWILNQNACVTCLHCETQSEGSSTCFWIHCPLLSLSFSPPSLQVTHVNITAVTATRLHGPIPSQPESQPQRQRDTRVYSSLQTCSFISLRSDGLLSHTSLKTNGVKSSSHARETSKPVLFNTRRWSDKDDGNDRLWKSSNRKGL